MVEMFFLLYTASHRYPHVLSQLSPHRHPPAFPSPRRSCASPTCPIRWTSAPERCSAIARDSCSTPCCGPSGSNGRTSTSRPSSCPARRARSEEHTSELQSLMRISYAVFCLKKKKHT